MGAVVNAPGPAYRVLECGTRRTCDDGQSHHRCGGRPRRIGGRPKARLGRHRGDLRRAGGRLDRDPRRRAGGPRHGAARAGDDGRTRRRLRPLGRLRLRPRCGRRRDGLARRKGARLSGARDARADRARGEPLRSRQRRRQGLGPPAALLGAGLSGRCGGRSRICAGHARRRDTERTPSASRAASARRALSHRGDFMSARSQRPTQAAG